MATDRPQRSVDLVLHLDASSESQELRAAVERAGLAFEAIYVPVGTGDAPAVETPYGTFRGLSTIQRYLDLPARP